LFCTGERLLSFNRPHGLSTETDADHPFRFYYCFRSLKIVVEADGIDISALLILHARFEIVSKIETEGILTDRQCHNVRVLYIDDANVGSFVVFHITLREL